jgi:hypothetical protein
MADYGRVAALDVALVNETTPRGRVAALDVALVSETTARGRVAALDVALVSETTARGRVAALDLSFIWAWSTPVALVPDIAGIVGTPATFTSAASTGSNETSASVASRLWSWTAVPGGSAIANITPTPMPNNGGAGFISMANNAVLYHCEGNALDSSGNGNTAILSNVTTGAVGKVGSFAWSFDTTAAVATLTTNVPLGATYTVAFWFYNLGPTSSYKTACRTSTGFASPIIVWQTTNELGLWINPSLIGTGFAMSPANYTGWHHLAAVASGGTTAFYVDGVWVGTAAGVDSGALRWIGNSGGGAERFADRIDEWATWTRALSATEIATLVVNQSGNHAGAGTTFGFTPDIAGTYTVQYVQSDTNVRGTWADSANAVVVAAGVPPFQGGTNQGSVDQNGNAVPQGSSFAMQGSRSQGS